MVKIGKGRFIDKFPENNRIERIWVLAKTDFIQRYYGSFFGVFWAFINPLCQLVIYYYIFTYFFNNTIPNFALYVLNALLIWMFFSESTKKGLMVLKTKRYLYENISINKLDIFIATVSSTLFALVINFIIYFISSLFFDIEYGLPLLVFPYIILLISVMVYSLSLILSVMNVFFEDIHHFWDVALLVMFWSVPMFYDQNILIEKFRILIYLNPISGLCINVREILLHNQWPSWDILAYNTFYILILLVVSLLIFKKYSPKTAELL